MFLLSLEFCAWLTCQARWRRPVVVRIALSTRMWAGSTYAVHIVRRHCRGIKRPARTSGTTTLPTSRTSRHNLHQN
eukprot:10835943-Ditylum_brightwellii.AAC.1